MPPIVSTNTDIKNLVMKSVYLKSKDGNRYSYLQDVANFCIPSKAWITTIKVEDMRLNDAYLFDSRAKLALRESACGFHSKLTSSVNKWLGFTTIDPKKMQSGNVQRYFKDCSDIQTDINNASNWNEQILECYTDDLWAGSSPLATEEDWLTHVRYTSIPVQQCSYERDYRGEIVGLFRRFKYTAVQIKERWPNAIPKNVKEALDADKYFQLFDIEHYVGPRDIRDASKKDAINMPFRSVWYYPEEEHKFDESGYNTNLYAVLDSVWG